MDDVFDYISSREGLNFHALDEEEKQELEKASRSVVKKLAESSKKNLLEEGVRLCDIVTNYPSKSIEECKRVLAYIDEVSKVDISAEEIDEDTERLLRNRVLEMDPEDRNFLNFITLLNVGIFQAKKLQAALKKFEGESYKAPTSEISSFVKEERTRESGSIEQKEVEKETTDQREEETESVETEKKTEASSGKKDESEEEEEECYYCGDPTYYKHDCGELPLCPQCEEKHAGEECPECGGLIGSAEEEEDDMLL